MTTRPLLRVHSAGPVTTVQDLGRLWAQELGVPAGGAADSVAFRVANRLAGNPEGMAALELTLAGFAGEFLEEVACAVAGADLGATLNGVPVGADRSFLAPRGSRLRMTTQRAGCRAYLAIHGGIDVPEVLGSRATYVPGGFGGFEGRALRPGDVLFGPGGVPTGFESNRRPPGGLVRIHPKSGEAWALRAIRGPQDDAFTEEGLRTFFSAVYEVSSQADRMGCRLLGPKIEHRHGPDIVSDGIAWGSVQVPGSGQPLVLLADRQTTGGYAKIATVATVDLPLLAQLIPGDKVRFREVDLCAAREVWALEELRIRQS